MFAAVFLDASSANPWVVYASLAFIGGIYLLTQMPARLRRLATALLVALIVAGVFVAPTVYAQVQGPPIWCCFDWWIEYLLCWPIWLGC